MQFPDIDEQAIPSSFQDIDVIILIRILACLWKDSKSASILFNRREDISKQYAHTRFHGNTLPSIQLEQYLLRIHKYACQEPSLFVLIVLYAQRVHLTRPSFILDSKSIHRFIIASITIMIKCFCDKYYTNAFYAKVGGMSVQELNALELDLLYLMDWHLVVSIETIQTCYEQILQIYHDYKKKLVLDSNK